MIAVSGVKKAFHDHTVLSGLDLTVASGEIYGLLGGNGAGKTTTLHMVLGLIPVDEGQIHIGGRDVSKERPRVAFVPEVVELYPDLNAQETVALFASVAQMDVGSQAIEAALIRAGLDTVHHRRPLRVFSKGMRQKVALAIAEVQQAKAVLLDEPTSGLDPVASASLMQRLSEMKSRGCAILMTSHDVTQVAQVADRIGILREGRLVTERQGNAFDGPGWLKLYQEVTG